MVRYRRKKDPTNTVCCSCERPVWIRLGTYTMRFKHEHRNTCGDIEAISYTYKVDGQVCSTVWCPQCVELGEINAHQKEV